MVKVAKGKKNENAIKRIKKKKKAYFNVPNYKQKVQVKNRWRKPHGIDSKKRIRRKEFGACPRVGYKNTFEARTAHPLGIKEVIVNNVAELEKIKDQERIGVRIAGAVSKRKKEIIRSRAKEIGMRVFN